MDVLTWCFELFVEVVKPLDKLEIRWKLLSIPSVSPPAAHIHIYVIELQPGPDKACSTA